MEAVTAYECEWRCAASAPARSIQCISRPPSSAPRGLVSFGKTSSIISDFDSLIGLGRKFPSFGSIEFLMGLTPRKNGRKHFDFQQVFVSPSAPAQSTQPYAAGADPRASG